MADIFISYSSEDQSRVEPLAKGLEDQGWSVWWDRKIPPGKTFSQVIEEAINAAKCVIVLWSNESVKSDWVQNEAAEGARRRILVPALIDDVQIPFEFRRIQAADLTDWKAETDHPGFTILLGAVSEIVGPSPLKVKEAEEKRTEEERIRKQEEERKRQEDEQRKAEEDRQRLGAESPARAFGQISEIEHAGEQENRHGYEDALRAGQPPGEAGRKERSNVRITSAIIGFVCGIVVYFLLTWAFRAASGHSYGLFLGWTLPFQGAIAGVIAGDSRIATGIASVAAAIVIVALAVWALLTGDSDAFHVPAFISGLVGIFGAIFGGVLERRRAMQGSSGAH
jgi:hypothetical protein